MNIEVTSVSKTAQKLTEVASAIQVITGEDIRRSGASRLPDALRLAPNLQVAQVNSRDWAVTARGFNGASLSTNTLADKLLVMIDGRVVYNPLFGGVFWDVQNVLLEDINRIEVVSGPGGTLWGANAVNGVINIISKTAKETQGFYATGGGGSFLRDFGSARYGGHVGDKVFYRVYGQVFDRNNTTYFDTVQFPDKWNMSQGGFRLDYIPSKNNTFTLQGDIYLGNAGKPVTNTKTNGQNILARWSHKFSDRSDFTLQFYFDRTYRKFPSNGFTDELKTYDIELQHNSKLGKRQKIIWGVGYRMMSDKIDNGGGNAFLPPVAELEQVTGFVQDQISLVQDKLEFTIGTKLMNNYYSGFEYQPSGRLAYTPNKKHTVWAAVSRAIRGPCRFDVELTADKTFKSENVIAYELGYRVEPIEKIAISLAGFYNQYTDLRSLNLSPPGPAGSVFGNDQKARTWGIELAANYWIKDWWRLRTGYTYLGKKNQAVNAAVAPGSDVFEAMDPSHQFMIQSVMDIKKGFQVDVVLRGVDSLPASQFTLNRNVPLYVSMDVRLAYRYKRFEISVVGQDLLARKHIEFGLIQIPMSVYGQMTIRL
jgi:iron complex outermembrane receptor protein